MDWSPHFPGDNSFVTYQTNYGDCHRSPRQMEWLGVSYGGLRQIPSVTELFDQGKQISECIKSGERGSRLSWAGEL